MVKNVKSLADTVQVVKPGSKGHEALLSAGYKMDAAKARLIIKERKADPRSWPYAEFEKAEAFLAAFALKNPKPSSDKPGWKRSQVLV